jgi:hypothetical protein
MASSMLLLHSQQMKCRRGHDCRRKRPHSRHRNRKLIGLIYSSVSAPQSRQRQRRCTRSSRQMCPINTQRQNQQRVRI